MKILKNVCSSIAVVYFALFASNVLAEIKKLTVGTASQDSLFTVTQGLYTWISYGIAGLAVLVVGFGALQMWLDDKETGLQTIKRALLAVVIFALAPTVVNTIIDLL
jgi:ABC-type proline/glycine betaine transport system permease subunit